MRVTCVESATEAEIEEVWEVYDAVFGDVESFEAFLDSPWGRHAERAGFRLALAHDDDRLVGFAWGYTGERGQWWTDRAAVALGEQLAAEWLGGHFELVELAVLPGWRSRGLGRRIVTTLVDSVGHERLVLMTTARRDDPARRLYESLGWSVIGPGVGEDTVIMGRRDVSVGS